MLIYNDQDEFTTKRTQEFYKTLIPEDNFWRKVNKEINFEKLDEYLKTKYPIYKSVTEMFKILLYENHYNLRDNELFDRIETDMTLRCFLEMEPLEENFLDLEQLTNFKVEVITNEDINNLHNITGVSMTSKENIKTIREYADALIEELKNQLREEEL